MKIVFLDTDTLGEIDEIKQFDSLGDVVKYGSTTYEDTLERINGAEIVLTNKVVIDEEIMSQAPQLKYIGILATGTNNVDLIAAANKGITVQNVAGYSTESVAQHTFALLLSMLHQVARYSDYVNEEYSNSSIFTNLQHEYSELKGKTFGIIGLGTIGKRVAEVANCFGAKVIYYSTSGQNNKAQYDQKSLNELLKTSDVVSIHAPLNENTKNLISKVELKLMKETAILINTGRGGIVDELALANALNDNQIAGACVDVFEKEPIQKDNSLMKIINKNKLVMSPHIAWASVEARQTLIKLAFDYLQNFLKSELKTGS